MVFGHEQKHCDQHGLELGATARYAGRMADETAAVQTAAVEEDDDGDRARRLRLHLQQLGIRRDTPTWLIKEIIMQARRRAKGLRNRLEPAAATPPKRRSLRPRLPTTGHRRPQTATTATDHNGRSVKHAAYIFEAAQNA